MESRLDDVEADRSTHRLSDNALHERTARIIAQVEKISSELTLQTERLAETLSMLHSEVVEPLRSRKKDEPREHQ